MNHLLSSIVKPLITVFLGLVFASVGSADIVLTGITLHQTADATGAYAGGHYDTVGTPTGSFNLYVDNGSGGFVNSGNAAATAISIPLVSGTNTFNIYDEGSVASGLLALNLFFGGTQILEISALTTVDVAAAPTAVAAGVLVGLENVSGTPLPVPTGPAPGSLSFVQGAQSITLTSVEALSRDASLSGLPTGDRVSPRDSVPDGTDDGRVRFTLQVSDVTSPVPEPSLVVLTGLGFALLAFKTRR
jgi:hypothetical protein